MKSKKGQISLEFMLIILICIGYLQVITATVIGPSIDAAQDVTRLGQAKLSAEKLANAINEVSSSLGESKRTLHLFVPKDSALSCNTTNVHFEVTLYGGATDDCSDSVCVQNIPVNLDSSDNCNVNINNGDAGDFAKITIEKDSSGIDVS